MVTWSTKVTLLTMAFAHARQVSLWWGSELVLIYNAAYADMASNKHPHIFGRASHLAWAEIWSIIGPLASMVMEGKVISKKDGQFVR
jgi:hypothetical protein